MKHKFVNEKNVRNVSGQSLIKNNVVKAPTKVTSTIGKSQKAHFNIHIKLMLYLIIL